MTELGLVVGIDVVGLMLALLMWRGVSARDAGPTAVRRVGDALERAARAFLDRGLRSLGASTAILLAIAVALSTSPRAALATVSRLEAGVWTGAGLFLGASSGAVCNYVSSILAARGSARAAAASGDSVDAALSVAMRASGSAALLGEALSGLCVTGLFGLLYALNGGFAHSTGQSLPLATAVVSLLPSFALGAAFSALLLQRAGGTFHAASSVGSDQAGERDAGLEHDDARNPAVISELIGDHVGASATRNLDGFTTACVANVALLTVAAALTSGTPSSDPLALLLLPLVLRAFGAVASAFGIFVVRSDELSPSSAFLRGYATTAVIALAGIAGVSYWLLADHFSSACAAGALGLLSALLAPHTLGLGRRTRAVRNTSDSARLGAGALVVAGLSAALETVLFPVSILALAAATCVSIGTRTGMQSGAEVCLLVFGAAALSIAPFVLSVATLSAVADGARGIAAMSNADGESKRRSARLDDAGFIGGAVARRYAVCSSALSSLLVAWAIAERSHGTLQAGTYAILALACCGAVGGATVLGYAGSVAGAALRGARDVSAEVERQLLGFPRAHGAVQLPADYTPSYKSCVELTGVVSRRHAVPSTFGYLAAPVVLAFSLRLLFRASASELVPVALIWFVVVASLAGLTTVLAVDAARATLGHVRRAHRGREIGSAWGTFITADAWSDVFGNAAAPALQLLVKATAATALSIAPFLI